MSIKYFFINTFMIVSFKTISKVVLSEQFESLATSFKTKEKEVSAKGDLADEMADVLFVLICLANQTGVDLSKAFIHNLEKKSIRDAKRHAENKKLK